MSTRQRHSNNTVTIFYFEMEEDCPSNISKLPPEEKAVVEFLLTKGAASFELMRRQFPGMFLPQVLGTLIRNGYIQRHSLEDIS